MPRCQVAFTVIEKNVVTGWVEYEPGDDLRELIDNDEVVGVDEPEFIEEVARYNFKVFDPETKEYKPL